MIDRFISWLYTKKIWGPRCSDFEPECACCQRWAEHDEIFDIPTSHGFKKFDPCVVENKDIGLTTMQLKDVQIAWKPFGPKSLGHFVDLGYDQDGMLVGINIWDIVADSGEKHD